jgi:L-ribulokinase
MFAATAAGIYDKIGAAQQAMTSGFAKEYVPNRENAEIYREMYKKYVNLGKFTERHLPS